MKAAATIRLVAWREIRHRLRGRAFYISTALVVAAVLLGGVVHRQTSGGGGTTRKVGVVGTVPAGFDASLTAASSKALAIHPVDFPDADAAGRALAAGEVKAVVDGGKATVLYPDTVDPALQAILQETWAVGTVRAALSGAGLSAPQVEGTLTSARLGATAVPGGGKTTGGKKNDDSLAALVGVVGAIGLYIAIQLYGGLILMGVVEEKSSAVVEVLLARVRASHLLAGKVLGIGAVAMLQFVFLLAAAAVSLGISGVHVPAGVWAALPWEAVWFVGGFALYGSLFALAGAMVSRQEDAQGAAIPVNVVLVAGYLMMFGLVSNPGRPLARVLSLLPPFTPLLMPARIAAGKAAVVEIAVAVVLMALAVAGLARASGHIYARLVLQRGRRVRWSEAFGAR